MPHIVLLEEAMEKLDQVSAAPPTEAQANLMAAMQDADTYAHGSNPDQGVLDAIESKATSIKGYLDSVNPPSDIRLQSDADALSNLIP